MLQFVHGYGTKTVGFSDEDLDEMIKIVKALENFDVLRKGVAEIFKNHIKKEVICL